MLLTHRYSYIALANILHLIAFTTQQNVTEDTEDNGLTKINSTQKFDAESVNKTHIECDCSCGLANHKSDAFSPRIVNGVTSAKNEFPWMVRLSRFGSDHVCGGSLINDKYVLTAAHCLGDVEVEDLIVTFGEHDRCKDKNPLSRRITTAIKKDFDYRTTDNDIVLLKLNESVPITQPNIRPICLPPDNDVTEPDDVTTVAGWGYPGELIERPSCELQRVDLPVYDAKLCAKVYKFSKRIMEKKICAGYKEGRMDACFGDSGGPLMKLMDDGRYMIIGIVSAGEGCAREERPGYYTKVSQYLQFIRKNTEDGCFCSD